MMISEDKVTRSHIGETIQTDTVIKEKDNEKI